MKIKKCDIPAYLMFIGVFLFSYQIRANVYPEISNINILAYIGLLYAYNKHYYTLNRFLKRNNITGWIFCVCVLIEAFLLFVVGGNGWTAIHKIKMLFTFVFPALFIYTEAQGETIRICTVELWYKLLRFICFLMDAVWFIDNFIGKSIQHALVDYFNSTSVTLTEGRFISIYGHPLKTAMIFFVFLIWTLIRHEYKSNDKNYLVDVAVSIVGIGICGSKSGILLALILLVLCHFGLQKNKMKYMVGMIVILGVLYYTGAFDVVIDRLLLGISSGDLSSNRNSALQTLTSTGALSFNMFRGHWINYENHKMVFALEYPFLRFSYVNGMMFALLLYIVYFVIPFVKVIKSRNFITAVCVLFFMIYVNGNNGIASYNDDLMIYSLAIQMIFWITNISMENKIDVQ